MVRMEERKASVCTSLNGVKHLRKLVSDSALAVLPVSAGINIVNVLKASGINPCTVTYEELVAALAEGGLALSVSPSGEAVLGAKDASASQGEYVNALDLSGDWGSVKVRLHRDVIEGAASITKAIAALLEGVTRARR